ncbi:MAG: diaminohydroxyphosphoribosylaminopyrimidine deaminase [Frankiaceae bacterium]|nr:diaminohydroxyphosphoribosylaminopyrimidine deaminase [Frankiaceae bacterium]
MATTGEQAAMQRAIVLAHAALGCSNPNPAVGAVVLDAAGAVAGEGRTQRAGGNHAEIEALTAAGDRARGGVLVSTLEPCRHQGRTGACTDALVRAGIVRVVYAVGDPHEEAGGGAEELRAAGIDVEAEVLADEVLVDLQPWLLATRRRRPHVTWKYAATLDGRTAAADGTSRWITGPESRRDVHRLRAESDAVIVGIGTVLADDTSLTVRDWPAPDSPPGRQPLRVVVDGKARTPLSSHILDDSAPTLIAVGEMADERRVKVLAGAGAEIVELPGPDGRVDLRMLLAMLFDRSARLLLVEGGARLASSFVRERLVDRIVGYHAPALLGAGPPVLADAGIPTIGAAVRLDICDVTQIGADVRITSEVRGGH